MIERLSWDDYFMRLAEESAARSKDQTTKVGACLVKDKKVLSLGYNGAPRGFPDDEVPKINCDIPIKSKNTFMCHAELNSILNYDGSLNNLNGSILYVTVSPCYECAKILAQLGVKKIYYKTVYHRDDIWLASKLILDKCGIEYEQLL